MSAPSDRRKTANTVQKKMYRLMFQMFIPIAGILIIIFAMILTRNLMYASVSGNIVKVSGFNQDFKNQVDEQMYQYVSGRSSELPWEDVASARMLAEDLLKNTSNPDGRKAMTNVLSLCDNLSTYIQRIERTKSYDDRMDQLESNIYGITQLIEDYMYSYLYYEAGEMASIQKQLDFWLTIEIVFVVLVMLIVIPVVLSRAVKLSKSITEPIVAMNSRVEQIGSGDLSPQTPVETDDPSLALLSAGIEDMAAKLDRQIELNRQEQIKLRDIELSLIQAQINPHFLYNTLDAIVWLIEIGKNDQAEQMVTSLSSYFRSFLSDGRDIVTVAEEKQHIQSYLEIQQVRYRDIMEYEINIDPSIEDTKLPKMTLQPLVENAIYHGLKPKRGKGKIIVTGTREDDNIILKVSDTGLGMNSEELEVLKTRVLNEDTTSFGLTSSYKRLKILYGEAFTFDIESKPQEGTSISIQIPGKADIDNETIL
ncbi:sensor histidine kinase [Butyrivibrio sp. AE2032]|uniref:sensor histidine kinase n=1 Tax=Butyrivibrio sp. AE2032 TaxID=1458463 RepID=UPI00068D061E|nr:sensor histidine kinase [Butyrivibrio sp. AE2032]